MSHEDYSYRPLVKLNAHAEQQQVLDEVYEKLAKIFGITLVENRLTLRFGGPDKLHTISMVIDEIWPDGWHDANQRRIDPEEENPK